MASNNKSVFLINFFYLITGILLNLSCASIQSPQGGPKDTEAPKVISETPKNLTRNFKEKTIEIEFDEYFKLTNEFTEISVSPTQEVSPLFKTKQKTLEIEFKDTLETNTTYTINFGKAVQDVNESNILKNYSFVFSTGPKIDSLQISGKVTSSANNETQKEVTVFIIPISRDSIFGKKRASIFTTTDSSGNFSLKNLREDTYRIYALKEESGGDRIFNQPNEEIAFLKDSIKLRKDTSALLLKTFKQAPDKFRIEDRRIENDGRITLLFNKPINKPSLKITEPTVSNPIIEFTSKADTAFIWLREITFDSLKVDVLSDNKKLETAVLRRGKKDNYNGNILFNINLSNNKLKPGNPLIFTFSSPVKDINKTGIVLLADSVPINNYTIKKLPESERKYEIIYPWRPKKLYSIEYKENAITDIYNNKNKSLKNSFELNDIENFGNLALKVSKTDSLKNYIIQIVSESNAVLRNDLIDKNKTVTYLNFPSGKYKIKVIEDINKNGVYDTGNVTRREQPEKLWFYEKEIIIRPNWEREEEVKIPKEFI